MFILLLAVVGLVDADKTCRDTVRHITYSAGINSRISPNIAGEWTSSRCEVRPGPKFFTRYIRIFRNSTWEGHFHRYSDYLCTKPRSTLSLTGNYKINGEARTLKGATSASFNFTRIELYPHIHKAETAIINISNKSCRGTVKLLRTASNGRKVFVAKDSAFSKRSCRNEFGISEYELSLLKLETRRRKGTRADKLYFAEISTSSRSKRRYQPTSYQMPLLRSNAGNCTICTRIRTATVLNPPAFPIVRRRPVMLQNAWGSIMCETQPGGTFLTRYMTFHYSSSSWEGNFYYFLDPYCKTLNFIIYGKGVFTGGDTSRKVPGGVNYVFKLNEAKITPYDPVTTRILNTIRNNQCGKDGTWQHGVEQSITESRGCSLLGISLPHTEYDLLMMDHNEHGQRQLYVGQKSSDGSNPTSPSLRPTSYQIPLVECSSFDIQLKKPPPEPTKSPTKRYHGPRIILPMNTPSPKRGKTTVRRKDDPSKGTNGRNTNEVIIKFQLNSSLRLSSFPVLVLLVGILASWWST